MSSVDNRIVQMSFDNAQFEQGVATTMASLSKLNQSLQLQGATKGLQDVDSAANGISLEGLASGIDAAAGKFKLMSVVGVAALATITSKIVDTGIELAKSFVIDPIKDGFNNYETQINAVQTILANTSSAGTNLSQVTAALAQLNQYANLTVYNFSEMAQNIGTFTAAGVDLNTSVSAIKGIANLAAFSGSTSQQASTAMYQLSQAIAAGTVKLQDWNSVVNAGLGGKTFQTALENTARASGVAIDSIIQKSGSFRNSLQQGWLTSDILTKTLSQFTGDLSVAQIKAMGYTQDQAQQIYNLSQVALNAATKIKTMTQLTQALKEEVSTAYAAVFKTIFGNITDATTLFSGIHTVAENALTNPIYALNTLLTGFVNLGGRTVIINTLATAFHELSSVMGAISGAFREIFPPTTAAQLYDLVAGFANFILGLKMGDESLSELKRTFAGVFAVINIGVFLVKNLADVLLQFIEYATQGSGSILKYTASLGDFLVKVEKLVENSSATVNFFTLLANGLQFPIDLIKQLVWYVGVLYDKFTGHDAANVTTALHSITSQLTPIGELGKLAADAWGILISHLSGLLTFLSPLEKDATAFFQKLGASVNDAFSSLNFNDLLGAVNTGLFAGLLLLIKKFIAHLSSEDEGPVEGIVKTIKESFESLTNTLETMQGTLKAATLLEIALAVGVLTISMIALSKIDQAGLIKSASAITIMFTQLLGSMVIFQKFIGGEGFIKMPIMTLSLILLAAAVDILVIAVKQLAGLDWDSLSKGLTGLGVLLAELVATTKLMGNPEGLITTALGLTAFARAVKELVGAVVDLSGLSWDELGKGLTGVAGLLASLALFSKFAEADKVGVTQGAGIILLAVGIKILAGAMQTFASMSWDAIGKGLTGVAGGLALIVGALNLIPPNTVLSAASVVIVASALGMIGTAIAKMGELSWGAIGKGVTVLAGGLGLISAALALLPPETVLSAASIFIVAASLNMIATALAKMGAMSWGQIAKSLVELAGSLAIIAAAVVFMIGALPGAAALLVVAGALLVLVPVLKAFGNMSWASLGESMVALVAIFAILGGAALILTPLVPVLLALGAAIALLGIGVLAAGVGIFAFSVGLTAIAAAGSVGTAALVAMIVALAGLIPTVATQLGLGIVAFASVIAKSGPVFVGAITTVLLSLLAAIAIVTPKVVTTMLTLLLQLLQALENYVPKLVSAGIGMIAGFLQGIANNIGKVITAGANIIIAFINGIEQNAIRVSQAAVQAIINFVNSLAAEIRTDGPQLGAAAGNLATAIIQGMVGGLGSGVNAVVKAAENVADSALKAAEHWLGINSPSKEFHQIGEYSGQGLANGLDAMSDVVGASAAGMGKSAMLALSKTISGLSDRLPSNIDLSPTITPVLDLTGVKKSAGMIGGILDGNSISVNSTHSGAVIASVGYEANQKPVDDPTYGGKVTPSQTVFNQTINSPKAVPPIEIYRQTKNLISQQRGVLVYADGSSD